MASVSLKNVSKTFAGEREPAIRDLSVEIAEREFAVLVGPPGCGKSTALRLIAGLQKVSQGEIFIGEKRVNELAPKDRDVGMVFQNDALYPQMRVFDNLAFSLKLRKYGKAEIRKRVLDAAAILGLEDFLDRKPQALTVAQRQRVAIARAIVRQPKVLLFDEPLAPLEAKLRPKLRAEISGLHQRLQGTAIYATEDPAEAMTLADRLVVLDKGVLQQVGSPLTVYNEPSNLFVAGYFGTPAMNFINGTLKAEGDKIRFREIEGGTIEIVLPADDRPAAREFIGKSVILGIRPEDLEAAPFNRQQARTSTSGFPAVVDVVEPMGAVADLYLQTGAHTLVCRTRQALDRHEAGHRFQFEINLAKAHLFDPDSTGRIV